MATPMKNAQALIEKIQSLPTDRIAEVEDFVDFLQQRVRLRTPYQLSACFTQSFVQGLEPFDRLTTGPQKD